MRNTLSFDSQSLGSALRLARIKTGITFRELCAASGVVPSQILRVESGEHDFTFGTAVALCGPLGLRPGLLLECAFSVNPTVYKKAYHHAVERGGVPAQWAKYVNGPDKDSVKEEPWFENYAVATAVAAEYLLRSSAPVKLLNTMNFIPDGQKEQLERLATKLSEKPLPIEDQLDHLEMLQSGLFTELERLRLLSPDAIEKFILWRRTFTKKREDYVWIPEPFYIPDKLAEFLFT